MAHVVILLARCKHSVERRLRGGVCLAALALAFAAQSARAADANCKHSYDQLYPMASLCMLQGLESATRSLANDISADGLFVGGTAKINGVDQAFVWSNGGGYRLLSPVDSSDYASTELRGLSYDGTIAVGQAVLKEELAGQNTNTRFPALWNVATGQIKTLGADEGVAFAANSDGTIVVGRVDNASVGGTLGFVWRNEIFQALPVLPGGVDGAVLTGALGVNGNGTVIVGYNNDVFAGKLSAVRWDLDAAGGAAISTLPAAPNELRSSAVAITPDASVIVGYIENGNGQQAARWQNGQVQLLGVLETGGSSTAADISDNGLVVVGSGTTAAGRRGILWEPGGELVEIGTLTGHSASEALAVSADGSVVVGVACTPDILGSGCVNARVAEALIWRAGDPQSVANTMSVVETAMSNQSDLLAGLQGATLDFGFNNLLVPFRPGIGSAPQISGQGRGFFPKPPMALRLDLGGVSGGGRSGELSGSVALDLGDDWSVGAGLSIGYLDADRGLLAMDGPFWQAGAYIARRPTSGNGTSMTLGASVARHNLQVTRLPMLSNTETGQGDTKVTTRGLFADVGYRLEMNPQWAVRPYMGIARYVSKMQGYTEAGTINFPVTYAGQTSKLSVARLGFDFEYWATADTTWNFEIGLEHDIARSFSGGTASSLNVINVGYSAPAVRNKTRPFIGIGLAHEFAPDQIFEARIGVARAAFSNNWSASLRLGFVARF